MAKVYRTIKFDYNATSTQIDVRTEVFQKIDQDLSVIRESIDGTPYEFSTGDTRSWRIRIRHTTEEIYDFFYNAYSAYRNNQTVTFSIEQDDGAFNAYTVIVRLPEVQEDTIGLTDKVYKDLSIDIIRIASA